jgi:hypothetical protein
MGQQRPARRIDRPTPVILIACFQFLKAGFLLTVAGYLLLAPDLLPHSIAFTKMLFIAAHGRDASGVLIPVLGCYVAYVGVGIFNMRPSIRRTLAISSAITICLSLRRLGVFGEATVTSPFDRQAVYILILLDLAIYIYLAFHPELVRCFKEQNRPSPYQRPTSAT